ncbi:MgtC/SapB family protein [Acinetobacter rathckeae]|uniref:MgtC/SapB family protein n=1 Tax=Acinetobacter rathckeae TaxID=2605272 RepID=UPI0018A292E2|nr:MgtC/SapB family protein [Acinetobacter rathckeae]MBF7687459.1 MgtC/SapB family protein [Acinetobacter rathckeae]MBF7694860.1 MgtC/SapB family protein [Acinetobacter rathckeae]
MQMTSYFHTENLISTVISLTTAFILGGLIGFERQYRQRTAGLRTNVLVCLGAAAFVDTAMLLDDGSGAVRVISYVVSGIGFLGAGVIMREGGNIQGLNTAATLWCSAAIGAAAGSDLIVEAIIVTLFILAANTLLRPIVHFMDRRPLDIETELLNVIYVVCDRLQSKEVIEQINIILKQYHYPAKDIEIEPFGEQDVEIETTLISTSIEQQDMFNILDVLNHMPQVRYAYWDKNTMS